VVNSGTVAGTSTTATSFREVLAMVWYFGAKFSFTVTSWAVAVFLEGLAIILCSLLNFTSFCMHPQA
jgi:hypothetical protein